MNSFQLPRHNRSRTGRTSALMLGVVTAFFALAFAQSAVADDPAYWAFAPTPPMGWNSYDTFGASVTEDEVMANATYIKGHLLSHGWNYVVVDYRWYDENAKNYPDGGSPSDPSKVMALTMDTDGRLLPAPGRFPSANAGAGFKPLADQLHALGLKFGFHIMRGIPRLAVSRNTPIEGSDFHAADAADEGNTCSWDADMYGVKGNTPAGQAYYDSLFRLYASWGLDFVKVDDLSSPYHADEIEAIRRAIDKCGRPIVFSTSPGETPVQEANHISTHANMWRVSNDFWDRWDSLNHAFDLGLAWHSVTGPGHWPDYDMIPFGKIGTRSVDGPRMTRLTHDEQVTLLSFWSLMASPLMYGGDLSQNDDWTLGLLTNDEMLAIDQDPLGHAASRVSQKAGLEVWVRDLKDGSKAVGLFNRTEADSPITAHWSDAGLSGMQTVRDVWQHKDLDPAQDQITETVPKHGAVLLRLKSN